VGDLDAGHLEIGTEQPGHGPRRLFKTSRCGKTVVDMDSPEPAAEMDQQIGESSGVGSSG
jgi:hypothetical protein